MQLYTVLQLISMLYAASAVPALSSPLRWALALLYKQLSALRVALLIGSGHTRCTQLAQSLFFSQVARDCRLRDCRGQPNDEQQRQSIDTAISCSTSDACCADALVLLALMRDGAQPLVLLTGPLQLSAMQSEMCSTPRTSKAAKPGGRQWR